MNEARQGTVVESYGRRLLVTPIDAESALPCKLKGRRLSVVAGDEVRFEQPPGADEWVVTERLPRRNVLARSDSRGRAEPIAANLDQLCVVIAARPPCDPFIVDRYLAGAAFAGIGSLLIVNKADLAEDGDELAFLDSFSELHLQVLRVSAKTGLGLEILIDALSGRRSILAGQSGVGKSSLLNALAGDEMRATGHLSDASGEGRHTTVSSALIRLPWGELADSPGVRDYAPPVVEAREVQTGYPEILALSAGCRFLDCLHRQEPQCAVREAAEQGTLHPRRYESYRRLLNLNRELVERRGWRD